MDEAEQFVRKALAEDWQSADALYLLGHILERKGNPRESLEWYTKAAAMRTPQTEDLRSVGLDYVLLNDYPDAIHWLKRATELDSHNAEAWYDLARAHMMHGDSQAAEKALVASLRVRPKSVKAENNLGVVFENENRVPEAIAAYRQAISWDEGEQHPSEQPFLNLGTLLNTQQRAGDAVPLLRRAIGLAPGNVKAHEQLARALEASGALTEALAEMQLAVHLAQAEPRLHFELGQMYRRASKPEEARKELELSQQLYGTHSTKEH
jgi:tetratricopeptide (TPR) repeat protein